MKAIYKTMLAVTTTLFFMAACSDDDSNPNNNNNNDPQAGFTWSKNGGAEVMADSAYYDSQYKTIKVWKGPNMQEFIEINLTADAPATYPIGTGYAVTFVDGPAMYIASAGDITISEKTASEMSGTITSTGSGAGITSLNAEFTNIEVR